MRDVGEIETACDVVRFDGDGRPLRQFPSENITETASTPHRTRLKNCAWRLALRDPITAYLYRCEHEAEFLCSAADGCRLATCASADQDNGSPQWSDGRVSCCADVQRGSRNRLWTSSADTGCAGSIWPNTGRKRAPSRTVCAGWGSGLDDAQSARGLARISSSNAVSSNSIRSSWLGIVL